MSIVPKTIYKFNAILIKMPMSFFIELLKFRWKCQRSELAKAILHKNNKAVGIMTPSLKAIVKKST